MSRRGENPFIGPRSFRTGETLYGRDHETNELVDLLIAERVVLLNSPSGAGKSSLLNAGLLPRLRAEGFVTPRPIRVSQQLPPEVPLPPGANRFIVSLLLSLEEGLPAEKRMPLEALLALSFPDYLDRRRAEQQGLDSVALLIDQFEEILTIDPNDRDTKLHFFDQMAHALRAKHRWALFAMREEFVAALEPFARVVPTRLATRFRLDLLRPDQALDAICRPAALAGVPIDTEAAEQLVRNLSLIRVQQPDGTTVEQPGNAIEPVQLQVVMRRLWDTLPDDARSIDVAHVRQVGEVDRALAEYYRDLVAGASFVSKVPERTIREWISQELITEQGFRNQVPQQPDRTRGLDNRALAVLVDGYLIRADKRRGLIWYELAHDRLVSPIQGSNTAWLEAHLHPLQRQAALWANQSRSPGLLLRAGALSDAEAWASENDAQLRPVEREFLDDCREARNAEERERQAAKRLKRLAVAASIAGVFSVLLAIAALVLTAQLYKVSNGVRDVVVNAFGWIEPTFDPQQWRAALDANSALAKAFSGVTPDQIKAAKVTYDQTGASEATAQGVILFGGNLTRLGFASAPVAGSLKRGPAPGVVQRALDSAQDFVALLSYVLGSAGDEKVPRVAVSYDPTLDPDLVRVVVFLLMRARVEVVELKAATDVGRGVIHVEGSVKEDQPFSIEQTDAVLGNAAPHPWFNALLETDDRLKTAVGNPSGVPLETQLSFQQFEGGSMVWTLAESQNHYVLREPSSPSMPGMWNVYQNIRAPSAERVKAFLASGDLAKKKLFQANGGFLQIWLQYSLEDSFGWPLGDTVPKEPAGHPFIRQNFKGGTMIAPLPIFDKLNLDYGSGRLNGQVMVLVMLNDHRYFVRAVKDAMPP